MEVLLQARILPQVKVLSRVKVQPGVLVLRANVLLRVKNFVGSKCSDSSEDFTRSEDSVAMEGFAGDSVEMCDWLRYPSMA